MTLVKFTNLTDITNTTEINLDPWGKIYAFRQEQIMYFYIYFCVPVEACFLLYFNSRGVSLV
jgi:hypothetical protein